ncbi:MAG TPA: Rho termination factor N-terminal domain-containing protein [Tepidisphaeraceae bacterium]|jgi:DNA-directed RNA polymerase subunit RPC12/RpoP
MNHIEETCTECGKTITKRAVAHVYHNLRVVCTNCMHKLQARDQAEEDRRNAVTDEDNAPATEPQIRFARELGIPNPERYHKWDLSAKISEAVEERNEHEHDPVVKYVPVYKSEKTPMSPWVWILGAIVAAMVVAICAGLMKL